MKDNFKYQSITEMDLESSDTMKREKRGSGKRVWIIMAAVLLLIAAGAAFVFNPKWGEKKAVQIVRSITEDLNTLMSLSMSDSYELTTSHLVFSVFHEYYPEINFNIDEKLFNNLKIEVAERLSRKEREKEQEKLNEGLEISDGALAVQDGYRINLMFELSDEFEYEEFWDDKNVSIEILVFKCNGIWGVYKVDEDYIYEMDN